MAGRRSDPRWAWSAGSCLAPWDEASGVPQGGVYARIGDVLAVIKATALRAAAARRIRAGRAALGADPARHGGQGAGTAA